ncbi:MAG: hypothetical protein ACRC7O_13500 [Fimbriiglobus sp.]
MPDVLRELPPLPAADLRLVEEYVRLGRPSDDLPYAPDFGDFLAALRAAGDGRPEAELVRRLFRLRKSARLPRASRPSLPIGEIPESDIALADDLIRRKLGTLGGRDQLPYTDEFEQLLTAYNLSASRPLTPHQFWRLVARISK